MKAILMSIRPKWVAKILNGEKTIEVRKKFPKNYVGWVYLCITQDTKDFLCEVDNYEELNKEGLAPFHYYLTPKRESKYHKCLNGKVVARFWCDKVEEHKDFDCMFPYNELRCNKATCLNGEEIEDYGFVEGKGYVPLYAIHITKLEIFDKPKELKEFKAYIGAREISVKKYSTKEIIIAYGKPLKSLTRAPQSWCYVEV